VYGADYVRYRNIRTKETLGEIDWFWLSQMEIIPGFWATSCRSFEYLSHQICNGAINIVEEAIVAIAGVKGLSRWAYPPPPASPMNGRLLGTIDWINSGRSTYLVYAFNAKSGVVCDGIFTNIDLPKPLFANSINEIELFHSPAPSVLTPHTSSSRSQSDVERHLIELMRLDAWLSKVGGTQEIRGEPSRLLIQMPALVQRVMNQFEPLFMGAELSSLDGGAQFQLRRWGSTGRIPGSIR
jgi:hypothetical protein